MNLKDKKILITGGTGFLGRRLVERLLDRGAEYIRIYSRDEHKQEKMEREFNNSKINFVLGDVRDSRTLNRSMSNIDIVYHLAALKVVPHIEYSPFEAIQTNVIGTYNVIDTAIDNGIKKCLFASTDKSVQSLNSYGMTKGLAERLFIRGNVYSPKKTLFSCVRFGNLFGSTGSVIWKFMEGRKKGVLNITDKNMTRFLLTVDDALDLMESASENMIGGEVFVPKTPSIRILDLAKAACPDCKLNFIGIRPGEKKHEILITPEESRYTLDLGDKYALLPIPKLWQDYELEYPEKPTEFEYRSDNNTSWLDVKQLETLIRDMEA